MRRKRSVSSRKFPISFPGCVVLKGQIGMDKAEGPGCGLLALFLVDPRRKTQNQTKTFHQKLLWSVAVVQVVQSKVNSHQVVSILQESDR